MNGSGASPAGGSTGHTLTVALLGAHRSKAAQPLRGSNLNEVCFYGTGTTRRTHLCVLRMAAITEAGSSMANDSSRGSAMMGVRSGNSSAKVWGRVASGDSGSASRRLDGAWSALKWCGSSEVFGATPAMGKNRARGHRGLYLKGKGVVLLRDFTQVALKRC
jgi:hypothetical protein